MRSLLRFLYLAGASVGVGILIRLGISSLETGELHRVLLGVFAGFWLTCLLGVLALLIWDRPPADPDWPRLIQLPGQPWPQWEDGGTWVEPMPGESETGENR